MHRAKRNTHQTFCVINLNLQFINSNAFAQSGSRYTQVHVAVHGNVIRVTPHKICNLTRAVHKQHTSVLVWGIENTSILHDFQLSEYSKASPASWQASLQHCISIDIASIIDLHMKQLPPHPATLESEQRMMGKLGRVRLLECLFVEC